MGVAIPQLAPASQDRVSGSQVIDGSLKFDAGKSEHLKRTPGSTGNRRTWTWAAWIKRDVYGADKFIFSAGSDASNQHYLRFKSDNKLEATEKISDSTQSSLITNALHRDTGWYHLVYVFDSTQSTSSDRVSLYVNGVKQTSLSTNTYPSQNHDSYINNTSAHYVGSSPLPSAYYDGSISQVYLIDGLALGPGYFGFTDPLTNTWKPKKFRAVGTTINDGTVWSSLASVSSGSFQGSFPATNGFNGTLTSSDRANGDTNGSSIDLDFSGKNIIVKNDIAIWSGKSSMRYSINGGEYVSYSDAIEKWKTIPFSGKLISLKIKHGSDSEQPGFSGLAVDGVTMLDSTTTNLDFGTNGFYLPMDGNSPIGQDKSGKGNDWRPVNFGGSVELDNPIVSGARPILNTTQGGTQAGVGVFGSKENKYYTTTSATNSGGKYVFENEGTQPTFSFIRGATYTFDYSASDGHPLRFATAADAAGSTEYTNGTSVSGNVISFTVPHNAPNTLYYYCTNHGNMGNSISVTTDETKADPYAWKCILAVPGVGGDYTDKSAQINCTSTTKASSAGGDPSSDSSSNFYNSSIDLDGNDKVTYTRTNAGDFSGQSDFTIEAWFNTDTTGATDAALFSNWDSGNNRSILFGPNASGSSKFTFIFNTTGSGSWTTVANPSAIAGKWMHVAWVYDHSATRHYAYINGVLQGSATGTAYNNSTANFLLGVNKGDGSGYYNGKVQDLRYYHAVKYTASGTTAGELVYTLPSTSPDILPDTPSGVAGGSKLTKITDGAVSFDATGDYLSMADSSDFAFGTGDFTAECFIYPKGNVNFRAIIDCRDQVSDPGGWILGVNANDQLYIYTDGFLLTSADTNTVTAENKWYHVAYVRNSGTHILYIDGREADRSSTSINYDTDNCVIGASYAKDGEYWNGFISNVRLVKGTALYTADFTPPTAPLTNVTNTKLLCCQSNTSATEGAVKPGTITANGDAAATNFNPFNTDINTVRGQETGYATLNPLDMRPSTALSNGNLTVTGGGDAWYLARSTQFLTTGKYYWEYKWYGNIIDGNNGTQAGLKTPTSTLTAAAEQTGSFAFQYTSIYQTAGSTNTVSVSPGSITPGDCVMFAYDADAGLMWFGVNGIWNDGANPALGTNSDWKFLPTTGLAPFAGVYGTAIKMDLNFGQKPFKYAPPDGFQPVNTANTRPVKVISRPDQYVGVTTYKGTGSLRDVNVGMQPDLVWIKRTDDTQSHIIVDVLRGSTKELNSDQAAAEGTFNRNVTAFNSNGFRVWDGNPNATNADFVTWTWKAGGNKNTFNVDDVGYASASDVNMSVGSLNSVAYDTSQTWSNNLAVNTGSISAITQAFNGNLTNGADSTGSTGSNDRTMTATLGLTLNNEIVEVFPNHTYSGYYATIDGVAQPIQYFTATNGFQTMGPFTGTLTSVTVTNGTESSQRPAGIRAIRVGGKILVDNGITPPDLPTIAPSGASVGTKQGFSIIKYDGNGTAGSSIPHGLSQIPKFVIVKDTEDSDNWQIYHEGAQTSGAKLLKFTTAGASDNTGPWNNTAPTSKLISLGGGGTNDSNNTHICYAWHDVPGLQKFGKYSGLDGADGPYVELGFRPALVIFKRFSSDHSNAGWYIYDSSRNPRNPAFTFNVAEANYAERRASNNTAFVSTYYVDFLSNGFKLRHDSTNLSVSGQSYIYCAWAEAPSIDLFGGGANAR